MAKMKGVKFVTDVAGPDKATIEGAMGELNEKLDAKFPMVVSVGKGKEKVSVTIELVR